MPDTSDSLAAQFATLQAERERSWPPERLAANIGERRALVAAFDPATVVKPGDRVAPFTLVESGGAALTLDDLVASGPAVLVFFRFAGCPACNLALPYYDRALRPALEAAGGRLVAVSPHRPDTGLGAIGTRHALGFPVAWDQGNTLARRFGLAFAIGEVPAGQPTPGWIGELTGLGTAELPQPAVILIDTDRTVRYAAVSPDWLVRPEADAILAAVNRLEAREAA